MDYILHEVVILSEVNTSFDFKLKRVNCIQTFTSVGLFLFIFIGRSKHKIICVIPNSFYLIHSCHISLYFV